MISARQMLRLVPAVALAAAAVTIAPPASAQQVYVPQPVAIGAPAAAVRLSPAQLDQLTAPIALYPDPLIAQVLPAATYPNDVLAAAQFVGGNPNVPDVAIDQQPWEPSVKALAHYPEVLQLMSANPSWTQQLGAAYVNQPGDVMDSIQRLRAQAQSEGALYSTPQQVVQVDNGIISILPAQPDVIYVPEFDPGVIFLPDHDRHRDFHNMIRFSTGHHAGAWLDNDTDWHDHYVVTGERWDHRDRGDHGRPVAVRRGEAPRAAAEHHAWTRNDKKPMAVPQREEPQRHEDAHPAADREGPAVVAPRTPERRGEEARPVAPAPQHEAPRVEQRPSPAPAREAPRAEQRSNPAPAREAPRAEQRPAPAPAHADTGHDGHDGGRGDVHDGGHDGGRDGGHDGAGNVDGHDGHDGGGHP